MDANNRINYMSERIYEIMDVPAGTVINFDGVAMIRGSATDPIQRDEAVAAIAGRRPFRGIRLRFGGRETMETRIFGRLTAWQNWIFQRPNAVGEKGALKVYGKGEKASFDWERV